MKNTGLPYESLAQKVFSEITNQDSVRTINVLHNVVLEGKTTDHQIDIYWEFEIAGIVYRTIVQAKDWKSKVPQGAMLQFKAILDDLPGQPRGVFVTRTGYQNGAVQVAKANDIILYQLSEPDDGYWEGKIKTIVFNYTSRIPKISDVKINEDKDWIKQEMKKLGLESEKISIQVKGNSNELHLYDINFQPKMTIGKILETFIKGIEQALEPTFHEHFFEDSIFLKVQSDILPFIKLKSISTIISFSEHNEEIVLDGSAVVSYILRNVLSGKVMTFDIDLNIREK